MQEAETPVPQALPVEPAEPWLISSRLGVGVAVLLSTALFFLFPMANDRAGLRVLPTDEAYLDVAVARSLGEGEVISLEPGWKSFAPRSMLWVLLLAAGQRAGLPAIPWLLGLEFACLAALLLAVFRLFAQTEGQPAKPSCAPLMGTVFVAGSGSVAFWAFSGLETVPFLAFGLWSIVMALDERPWAAGLFAGLACWLRLEGLLLWPILALTLAGGAGRPRQWPSATVPLLGALGALLMTNYFLTGSPVPVHIEAQRWLAGMASARPSLADVWPPGRILRSASFLGDYLGDWIVGTEILRNLHASADLRATARWTGWFLLAMVFLSPLAAAAKQASSRRAQVLAALIVVLAVLLLRMPLLQALVVIAAFLVLLRTRATLGPFAAVCAWGLAAAAVPLLLLPLTGDACRYFAPLILVAWVALFLGVTAIIARAITQSRWLEVLRLPLYGALLALALLYLNFWRSAYAVEVERSRVTEIAAAEWISANVDRAATVAALDAGALRLLAPQPVVGIGTEPDAAKALFAGQIEGYLVSKGVRYLVLPGAQIAQRTSIATSSRFTLKREFRYPEASYAGTGPATQAGPSCVVLYALKPSGAGPSRKASP